MSSSNLVRVAYIEETEYGKTPAGDFTTMRKTSESLSGTPNTVESEEARDDRQSAGQIQVGLDVGGDNAVELSAAPAYADAIRNAMKQTAWSPPVVSGVTDITIDATAGTITSNSGGDFTGEYSVGDMVVLAGMTSPDNNAMVYISALNASSLTVIARGLVDETATGVTITRPQFCEIGQDSVSWTMEKNFLDLTDKSIVYRGMMVEALNLNFTWGQIATGAFSFVGAGYETPATPITDGRTVHPATTELALNASSDMGLVVLDGASAGFCIQSLGVDLTNNHQAKECLGSLAPEGYAEGTAMVAVNLSGYLADENFSYIDKKISQQPVEIAYYAQNMDGGLAVHIYAAQLSFSDPASGGKDQQVTLDMTGTAKFSETYNNSMRIYQW